MVTPWLFRSMAVLNTPPAWSLGDRHAAVIVQERHDLAAYLQQRHVTIEVDAVQALDVQHRVTIQQLRDRNHMRHDNRPAQPALRSQPEPGSTGKQAELSTSAVRGGASLATST